MHLKKESRAVYFAVVPTILLIPLTAAIISFRAITPDAVWVSRAAWVVAALAAFNPGMLFLIVPVLKKLSSAKGGYAVRAAVPVEGVDISTLNRCAAIAEAQSQHPIAACLRDYCGDVGAPPDRFVEMPGLGVSAQFSNQLIHAGSAEYLRGLNIEVPNIPGKTVFIALEGRALGFYSFFGAADTSRASLLRGVIITAAFKVAIWTLFAVTGTSYLAVAAAGEAVSFALTLWLMQRALKTM